MKTPVDVLQQEVYDMKEERDRICDIKNPHHCDRIKFEADRKIDLELIDERINEFNNAISKLL